MHPLFVLDLSDTLIGRGPTPFAMPVQKVSYKFTARLPASQENAFRWATDYRSGDFDLMGLQARRRVKVLTPDTILLTDTFSSDPFGPTPGGRTVKVKLVHIYPSRWAWTSTHLSGPARHSQFLYELIPIGWNSCRLKYTGNQVERVPRAPTSAHLAHRARILRKEDSDIWRHLAQAMRKDLARPTKSRRKSPRNAGSKRLRTPSVASA